MPKLIPKPPSKKMRFKLNIIVLGFLTLVFLILSVRTVYIACFAEIDGVKYGVKARNRQMSAVPIKANRGTIYDRNMIPIAQSATVWIATISPNQFKSEKKKKKVAQDLCDILEIEERDKIFKRFESKRKYEIIKKDIEKPKRDEILEYTKKNKLHNIVNLEEGSKRYYPLGSVGAHIIGARGDENKGLSGLEYYYNNLLMGINGKLLRVQDAKGGPMPYEYENLYPAINGNSIVISIDSVVQRVCSEALEDLNKWHAPLNRCLTIVMDVNTGEIIALAVNPEFNLNDPFKLPDISKLPAIKDMPEKEAREFNWRNKAVSENYEPGSVFKVLTASSALEEKTMSLDSKFYCNGSIKVQGEKMRCWRSKGHGSQDFTMACVNSCNPAFVEIGHSLGPHKFFKYLELFGITKKTGVDLPGETNPEFYKEKDLTPVSLASESFGQSLSITPLQMIRTFSTVVNGGFLYKPSLLKQVLDKEGNIIKTITKKPIRTVISKETSETMREILTEVVKGPEGKGTNASVAGLIVGGKTGTAQKLELKRRTGEEYYVSSFAGVLTADNPKYAILVLADMPSRGKHYGSDVASPTFNRIASKIAPHLGIKSRFTEEQYEQLFSKMPNCEGMDFNKATKILEKEGFKNIKLIGDAEDKILMQLPESGVNISKDSKIYLYTEEEKIKQNATTVPNVIGMTYAKAKEILNNCGLNMVCENLMFKPNNKGVVFSQFPENGVNMVKGAIVEVNLQMFDGTY